MPEYRFEHAGVTVTDIDEAVAWYGASFGFEETRRFEKAELQIKGATLQLGDDVLELLEPYHPEPDPRTGGSLEALLARVGANHFALNVDDASAAYEKLRADGTEMVTELLEGRFFFCRDPFGTLIEVRQRK